jgi:hypothetical protein
MKPAKKTACPPATASAPAKTTDATEPIDAVTTKLSVVEIDELNKLEGVIKQGLHAWWEVGIALCIVRDKRLYRDRYKTFDDYCQQRWKIGRRYADKLILDSTVYQQLPEDLRTIVLKPHTAGALAPIPPEKREALVKQIVGAGKLLTARAVREAAKPEHDHQKQVRTDETGYRIPNELVGLWSRESEVDEVLRVISHVKSVVGKAILDKDSLYIEVNNSAIVDLTNAYNTIKRAKPYAVCPRCQGRKTITANCTTCRRRGIVSKFMWDSAITKEDKELRAKAVAVEKERATPKQGI